MPIYEYRCPECEKTISRLQPMAQGSSEITCPECAGRARRVLSTFASATTQSSATAACSGGSCGANKFS